jgi:hypothetical protein
MGGTATVRVTVTGAFCQAPVSQRTAGTVAGGAEDVADAEAAGDAALADGAPLGGLLVAHDAAAAKVTATMAAAAICADRG